MRQYRDFKRQHPDYVLFFRMGDFYEMFWDDARLAHRVLGVTLTTRSRGGVDAPGAIPMAGIPFHALEGYLRKMIAAGHRVALCEQTEDPKTAKGVVKREVVRLMTPGTLTDEPLLDGRTENYLAAIASGVVRGQGQRMAVAWVELSTGQVVATSGREWEILDEIARLRPAEVCVPEQASGQPHPMTKELSARSVGAVTQRPGWQFSKHHAQQQIHRQWQARGTGGFGFADDDPANLAIGAVLSYLEETQKTLLTHLRTPRRHVRGDYLTIDHASYRSLEIDRTVRGNAAQGSLVSAIDRTRSPMGARLLRQWVRHPLFDLDHIHARQNAVAALLDAPPALRDLAKRLESICDIERIVTRLSVARASPRDLTGLGRCLEAIPDLMAALAEMPDSREVAPELAGMTAFCAQQAGYIRSALRPDPAPHLREGGVIATGFDVDLDRLRDIGDGGQTWLADYQVSLAEQSGISSLKVSYNKVFGYYIEVTDVHKEKVPPQWTRKQTVKNAERYITAELKEFESEALGARDKSVALEQRLFEQVRQQLLPQVEAFQDLAAELARLDVLAGLATLAWERRYCRPSVVSEPVLEIIDGRHPVLEQQLGTEFVSNDVQMNPGDSLQLITGPNMAGKSTFIRQVALITLLAQIGSYVPAKSATIGRVDRLFARIGASDELHAGQSTFMVEMTETANLLNNATQSSLVILDEIGRGTSTLDGLSLAWAISEHIAGTVGCRTLFATHYHELTELAERYEGVKNLNVAVREWEDQLIFLHRIVEGGTDRSYGIHVARLAGVPWPVLQRARQLLGQLAVQHVGRPKISRANQRELESAQLRLFVDPGKKLLDALRATDVDQLSPMAALEQLRKWKDELDG